MTRSSLCATASKSSAIFHHSPSPRRLPDEESLDVPQLVQQRRLGFRTVSSDVDAASSLAPDPSRMFGRDHLRLRSGCVCRSPPGRTTGGVFVRFRLEQAIWSRDRAAAFCARWIAPVAVHSVVGDPKPACFDQRVAVTSFHVGSRYQWSALASAAKPPADPGCWLASFMRSLHSHEQAAYCGSK